MKRKKANLVVLLSVSFSLCCLGNVFAVEDASVNTPPGMQLQKIVTPRGSSNLEVDVDQAGYVISKKVSPNSSLNALGALSAPLASGGGSLARAPFPIKINAETAGDIAVADLDLDGKNEVIVVTGDIPQITTTMAVRVFDERGNPKAGWTTPKLIRNVSSNGHQIFIGDIDNDAANDLEFCVRNTCFHHTGAIAWTPKNPPGCTRPFNSTDIAGIVDLDKDGKNELVTVFSYVARVPNDPCLVGSNIYVWNGATAQLLRNIPLPIEWKGTLGYDYTNIILGLAFGDIAGDNKLEIVASGFSGSIRSNIYNLHAYHHTGVNIWNNLPKQRKNILTGGSPFSFGYDIGNPTLVDVYGNDGKEEIAVIINGGVGLTGITINRGNPTGDFVPGWPQIIPILANAATLLPYINVGDLDGDGNLEIIATLNYSTMNQNDVLVFAYRNNGSFVQGWPAYFPKHRARESFWWGQGYGVQASQDLIAPLNRPLPQCSGNICTAPVLTKTKEVLIPLIGPTPLTVSIYTMSHQGQVLPSKTVSIPGPNTSTGAILVDLEKDGSLDVGIATVKYDSTNRSFLSNISFTNLNTQTPSVNEMHWPMLGKEYGRSFRF